MCAKPEKDEDSDPDSFHALSPRPLGGETKGRPTAPPARQRTFRACPVDHSGERRSPTAVPRDKLWEERSDNAFGTNLKQPPSTYIPGRVYGCIFDDETGLANRHVIGMDQICFETDYPHADSTFPHSEDTARRICEKAGLSDDEIYKVLRGNAIHAYGLQRFGITA